MRRYGNVLGILLVGLGSLLGAALLIRLMWNWSIPDVLGFGPIAFKHALGFMLLGLVSAGLLRLARHRDGWRHFSGRW
ncbi:MAG: hypothetical protein R3E40_10185 [Rhodocyclaceae bacterium]|nr:hypothetical protein [Rhodocyclaceae bacterium]MCB1891905.1 hypothetical protein [Rhodocyclaceae bacterium]MCP5297555.1 hypothetical protein [Zoogloeaceae bacterium]